MNPQPVLHAGSSGRTRTTYSALPGSFTFIPYHGVRHVWTAFIPLVPSLIRSVNGSVVALDRHCVSMRGSLSASALQSLVPTTLRTASPRGWLVLTLLISTCCGIEVSSRITTNYQLYYTLVLQCLNCQYFSFQWGIWLLPSFPVVHSVSQCTNWKAEEESVNKVCKNLSHTPECLQGCCKEFSLLWNWILLLAASFKETAI